MKMVMNEAILFRSVCRSLIKEQSHTHFVIGKIGTEISSAPTGVLSSQDSSSLYTRKLAPKIRPPSGIIVLHFSSIFVPIEGQILRHFSSDPSETPVRHC